MTTHPIRFVLPFLLASLATPARPLNAQTVVPDTQIQVRQCPPKGIPGQCVRTQGAFLSMDGDNLSLRDSAGVPSSVAWTPTTRVRVFNGRRDHLLEGMSIGLALGVGSGLMAAHSCGGDSEGCGFEVPILSGLGFVLGSLVGAVAQSDRWTTVERPKPAGGLSFTSVSVMLPTRTTAPGIGLRFAF
jgi:hypothetical protein